ncbi:MAG: SEC-C motif domain protein [Spirochaetes bacterium]|nr:MAG: SEC-C motif domain protein [Spirochaetota bacterium]
MTITCPCGSGREYDKCCGTYIQGKALAPTAEALMRSRYTAYATGNIDYILATCVSSEGIDVEETRRWSTKSQWLGLTIHGTEKGRDEDSEGRVDFTANYVLDGMKENHRESARFVKKDGRWLFDDGKVTTQTIVRAEPKVGRNDPCPCGSGKKYKKCCGAGG